LIIFSMLLGAGIVLAVPGVRTQPSGAAPFVTAVPGSSSDTSAVTLYNADPTAVYERVRASTALIETGTSRVRGEGIGSGVVLDKNGHILTNQHVVAGAQSIQVTLGNGAFGSATVVGTDPGNDLAVIKADIPAAKLQPAILGDSDQVKVGEPVFAVGNPLGQEFSITSGIVSAVGRTSSGTNNRTIRNVIQTDAPINPGNSGGPLVNARGEVIGINASLENPTGQNVFVGLGFAIPINTAKRFIPDMVAGKTVDHPRLGISAPRSVLSDRPSEGVRIGAVEPNSPADRAGLRAGDIIIAIDNKPMRAFEDIAGYLDSKGIGDKVTIKVQRDGRELTLNATLGRWNSNS
jgi:putative serine protease PepD